MHGSRIIERSSGGADAPVIAATTSSEPGEPEGLPASTTEIEMEQSAGKAARNVAGEVGMVTAMADQSIRSDHAACDGVVEGNSAGPDHEDFAEAARNRGWSGARTAWFSIMAAPASARSEKSNVATDAATAAADLVARSVATQEVPETVTETSVLAKVATVLRAVRGASS